MASNNSEDINIIKDLDEIDLEKIKGIDEYSYSKCGDFDIILKNDNKYINASYLCKKVGKAYYSWTRNKQAMQIIRKAKKILKIKKITEFVGGGVILEIRGTYVHPLLVTPILAWLYPDFILNISEQIEEWKKYSNENNLKYWDTLATCETYCSDDKEKQIQLKLQEQLGGEIEVKTRVGKIDLLTNNKIIEIKEYDNWKHALGQINAYSIEYKQHDKIIYLFDVPDDNDIEYIEMVCGKYNVDVIIVDE